MAQKRYFAIPQLCPIITYRKSTTLLPTTYTWSFYTFPLSPPKGGSKFHFAILRIEVTRASRGLSAIAELLVLTTLITYLFNLNDKTFNKNKQASFWDRNVQTVEFQKFSFQYVNVHWLLNELSMAVVRGPGGQLTPRYEKVKISFSFCGRLFWKIGELCGGVWESIPSQSE